MEIISTWKKGSSISQISREKGVSRPTIRKIVKEYNENQKWWLTRTFRKDGFIQLVINTSNVRNRKDDPPIERLALGVEHYELDKLIRSIIKRETADEIIDCFMRDPPRISILHIKKSELI